MKLPASLQPDWPAPQHVKLISTTRSGGYSQSPYDSFNLALHTNDVQSDIIKNRALLREHFHLPAEPTWLNQVHGNYVVSLDDGLSITSTPIAADASWATKINKVCAVLTADCLPVFITDIKGSVVAVAHAGWKGLLAGVITKTVNSLGVANEDVLVWFGPGIASDAFIVGEEVKDAFVAKSESYSSAFTADSNGGAWHCDIYQLARIELLQMGVEQVYGGGLCTYSDEERFFSYRRDGEKTGRQAHCIWLDNH